MRTLWRIALFSSCIAAMAVGVYEHVQSPDGFSGVLLGAILSDGTTYASGYSDAGFRAVRAGMTSGEVRGLLGDPLSETWEYPGCPAVSLFQNRTRYTVKGHCALPEIRDGISADEVVRLRGNPLEVAWGYSWSPSSGSYRSRFVHFSGGRVSRKDASFYFD